MSNRKEHIIFGIGLSLGVVVLTKVLEQKEFTLPELLGLILGSYTGSRLPDILEPAHHPNHRKIFHSVTVLSGVVASTPAMFKFADGQLEIAQQKRKQGLVAKSTEEKDSDLLSVWVHEFISGFSRTCLTGYASHLILDSTTPKSLPIL